MPLDQSKAFHSSKQPVPFDDPARQAHGKLVAECKVKVDELLMHYGGQILLNAVGDSIEGVTEGTFTAPTVGRIINELADLEW